MSRMETDALCSILLRVIREIRGSFLPVAG